MENKVKLTAKLQQFVSQKKIQDLSQADFDEIYPELISCLIFHNQRYYQYSQPLISDGEYDELLSYLKKAEQKFSHSVVPESPTQKLIGQIQEGFQKARHEKPLLSLENTYDAQDIRDFDTSLQRILTKLENTESGKNLISGYSYTVEPKFDGLSVELIFLDGIFSQAITRGDGEMGEDITENVKTIYSVPFKLTTENPPRKLKVRWEIMMPKSAFHKLNQKRIANGEPSFVNTRNAASGSVKLLDTAETAKRWLVCFVYDILVLEDEKGEPQTNAQVHKMLTDRWLAVHPTFFVDKTIDEVVQICGDENQRKKFEQEDIEFDGLVIKINQIALREKIGDTEHHPRRAFAYKYPTQLATTQILSVDFQVGRSGIITPAANVEPVQLSGVTISRASLHNFSQIREKDIQIGDFVWIQRSGEVIPYIVSVVMERRSSTKPIIPPAFCPVCQSPVTQPNGEIYYYCSNPDCPAQLKEKIAYFVSKNAMDIEWIGDSIIDLLVEQKLISSVSDLYKIQSHDFQRKLTMFPGIGTKKVSEISSQLEKSKKNALRRIINWLWIPHVGKKTAKLLQDHLPVDLNSLDKLAEFLTDPEFLSNIHGIGEQTILSLQNFFSNQKNIFILHDLKSHWVEFFHHEKKISEWSEITGLHFSITGSFHLPRPKIVEILESQWAIFDDEPIATTDFMLVWEKAGSKLAKAQKNSTKIFASLSEFFLRYPSLSSLFPPIPSSPQIAQQWLF